LLLEDDVKTHPKIPFVFSLSSSLTGYGEKTTKDPDASTIAEIRPDHFIRADCPSSFPNDAPCPLPYKRPAYYDFQEANAEIFLHQSILFFFLYLRIAVLLAVKGHVFAITAPKTTTVTLRKSVFFFLFHLQCQRKINNTVMESLVLTSVSDARYTYGPEIHSHVRNINKACACIYTARAFHRLPEFEFERTNSDQVKKGVSVPGHKHTLSELLKR
jgi:hypothetical protein